MSHQTNIYLLTNSAHSLYVLKSVCEGGGKYCRFLLGIETITPGQDRDSIQRPLRFSKGWEKQSPKVTRLNYFRVTGRRGKVSSITRITYQTNLQIAMPLTRHCHCEQVVVVLKVCFLYRSLLSLWKLGGKSIALGHGVSRLRFFSVTGPAVTIWLSHPSMCKRTAPYVRVPVPVCACVRACGWVGVSAAGFEFWARPIFVILTVFFVRVRPIVIQVRKTGRFLSRCACWARSVRSVSQVRLG